MNTPMHPLRGFIHLLVLTGILLATPSSRAAVPIDDEFVEFVRSTMAADRQATLAETMQFTEAEAAAFWPIYQQYRAEMKQVGDGMKKLVVEYAGLYPDVPDDRAKAMLNELAALEKKQVATRANYIKKVGKVLSAAKTLRFAQAESRLDLAARLELAAAIPLVPITGTITGEMTETIVEKEGAPGSVVVQTFDIRARVIAINQAIRQVTLLGDDGIKQTVTIPAEAVNLDQVSVGDRVLIKATREVVIAMAAPGERVEDGAETVVELAPEGAKPGGVKAKAVQVTGTVAAIDLEKRTATLRLQDGTMKTLPVRAGVDLAKRKIGEKVVFQMTDMIAVTVEKP
jgi:hypothetical protein